LIYSQDNGRKPLHEAVRLGDMATVQSLIQAGADLNKTDCFNVTPLSLVNADSCRALLEHHASTLNIITILTADPAAIIAKLVAHCADLSGFYDSVSENPLCLCAYQFDPYFNWAPVDTRAAIFAWVRDAVTIQFAAASQPFADLPDDCAGDILEFLETYMTHKEMMYFAMHCLSPEANVWVRAVFNAAVVVGAASLFCQRFNIWHDKIRVFYYSI